MFEQISGNASIRAYLESAVAQKTLPHAILFSGEGSEPFVQALGSSLLGSDPKRIASGRHPDFHVFRPLGKSGQHSIESIRSLIDQVYSPAFESAGKVFWIEHAERMQPAAGNALLKTLEEPLFDTTLLLTVDDERQMLPTILSRCTCLRLEKQASHIQIGFLGKKGLELLLEIEKIEKEIEAEEDPVRQKRRVEQLFGAILMWARDSEARKEGLAPERLFFPDQASLPDSLSLEKWEKAVQKAYIGYERNIKLSACLEPLLTGLF